MSAAAAARGDEVVVVEVVRPRAGGVGLQVDYPPGEHPRVSDVSGAAAAAGVRVGDGVLAVDDVDVAIAAKLGPYLPAAGAFTLILRRPRGGGGAAWGGAGSSDEYSSGGDESGEGEGGQWLHSDDSGDDRLSAARALRQSRV